MADVARAAGVSPMTVSRVLNGRPHVSVGTRIRVEDALQALRYRPNVAARALVTGRSGELAVMLFETGLNGAASTLFAIELAARREGYGLSLLSLPHINLTAINEATSRLRTRAIDGAIIIAPHTPAVEALRQVLADLPAVAVGGPHTPNLPLVAIDQEAGSQLATEHLLSLGHRTVWHIAGPSTSIDARSRANGWRRALHRAGLEPPPPIVGDWSARSGFAAGRQLATDLDATAVFVANHQMAFGVLCALESAGRTVPNDLSVVDFDDAPESPSYSPALTTVQQDSTAIGDCAIAILLDRIANPHNRPSRLLLEPQLVIRDSTSHPPGRTVTTCGAGRTCAAVSAVSALWARPSGASPRPM
jgi:DNA-binding LacI/PurR family transcriptional regulator